MPATKINSNKARKRTGTKNEGAINFIKVQLILFTVYCLAYLLISFIGLVADTGKELDVFLCLSAFAAASFISGFVGGNKTRKNGIVSGLIYAIAPNSIVSLASLISVGFKADYRFVVTVSALIIASVVGGIIAVNKRHRR